MKHYWRTHVVVKMSCCLIFSEKFINLVTRWPHQLFKNKSLLNNLKTIYPKHYFWVIYAHYDEEIMTNHLHSCLTKHIRSLRWRNHDKTCTMKFWQIIYVHVWQIIYVHVWQNIYDEIMTNHLRSCLTKHLHSLRWSHDKTYTKKFWQIIYEEITKIHEVRKAVSYTHLTLPTN